MGWKATKLGGRDKALVAWLKYWEVFNSVGKQPVNNEWLNNLQSGENIEQDMLLNMRGEMLSGPVEV